MSLDICKLIQEEERFHTCKGVFYNFTEEVIEKIAHYLEGIGMPEEHIRRVIFDATYQALYFTSPFTIVYCTSP